MRIPLLMWLLAVGLAAGPAQAQFFGGTVVIVGGGACPTATPTALGCVKIDGTSITIGSGVISAAGGVPALRLVTASGAIAIVAGDGVVAIKKTTGAATAVTLESSPVTGAQHVIKDARGDAATNPITISPASGTIDGAASFVLNVNYSSVTLVFNGTEWSVI